MTDGRTELRWLRRATAVAAVARKNGQQACGHYQSSNWAQRKATSLTDTNALTSATRTWRHPAISLALAAFNEANDATDSLVDATRRLFTRESSYCFSAS